jgi:hypothetical protein
MPTPTPPAAVRPARATAADKRLLRLAELEHSSGLTLYERASLASELIDDRAWVAARHGDDEGQAYDWLATKYFRDLADWLSVEQLVTLYRKYPREKWEECHYNAKRLLAEWLEQSRPRPAAADPAAPRATRAQLEEKEREVKELQAAVRRTQDQGREWLDEAAKLRGRVRELEMENAQLRGRIEELERLVRERAA